MFSSASSTPNSYMPTLQNTHPSLALIACVFGVLQAGLSGLQNLLGQLSPPPHLCISLGWH